MRYYVYGLLLPLTTQFFLHPSNTSHIQSTDWILDSGVTDHMIHSLAFFTFITFVVQISIRLPNGDMAKVTHIGTVQFPLVN